MISIIIPTYNRASVLEKVIGSYLSQKYVNEIIIINDASTDSTDKVIEELKMKNSIIEYVKHETNMGLAASRIDGITRSKSDLILFGEDDVLLECDYVEKLFNCLELYKAGIVGGRIITMYENETKKDAIIRWNNKKIPLIDLRYFEGNFGIQTETDLEVPFVHAIYLANKKIYYDIKLQTYYKGNEYREETDLQISVLKQGYKIMYCPNAICYHLPKTNNIGGCHKMNILLYEYWTIKNNNLFFKRHHEFLKRYGINKSRFLMTSDFAINRILYSFLYVKVGRWCLNIWQKSIIEPYTNLIHRIQSIRNSP